MSSNTTSVTNPGINIKLKWISGVLFFLAPIFIGFAGISQFHHWFAYYYLLVLSMIMVSGIVRRRLILSHINLYVFCYWAGFLIMLATAILSQEFYYPSRTLAKIFPIAVFIALLGLYRDREYHLSALFVGFITNAFLVAIYTAAHSAGIGLLTIDPTKSFVDEDAIGLNQNNVGFSIFCGIFAATLAYCSNRLTARTAFIIVAILSVSVLMTWSTRAAIGSALCLLAFFIASTRSNRRKWLMGAAALVGVGLWFKPEALMVAVGIPVSRLLGFFDISYETGVFSSDWGIGRAEDRYYLWQVTLEQFYENPLTGIGIENTRNILGTYSHFDLLEILAGAGILGAAAFYLGYLVVLKGVLSSPSSRKLKFALGLLWSTLMFFSVSNRIYDLPQVHIFLVAILIVAWSSFARNRTAATVYR